MAGFSGKVVALIGRGGPLDRALAVALAEGGADLALATCERLPQQEFAVASIANEVWAIGREQFSQVIDATHELDVAGFAQDVLTRLGRCDVLLVVGHDAVASEAFVQAAGGCRVVVVSEDGSDVGGAVERTLAEIG
jgi:NAD(P)-dependent dehydrogenase (short-subunit alcohol dehydrogenase family)